MFLDDNTHSWRSIYPLDVLQEGRNVKTICLLLPWPEFGNCMLWATRLWNVNLACGTARRNTKLIVRADSRCVAYADWVDGNGCFW